MTPWHVLDRRGEGFPNGLSLEPPLPFSAVGVVRETQFLSVPDPTDPPSLPTPTKQLRNQHGWAQKTSNLLYKDAKYMSMYPLSAGAAASKLGVLSVGVGKVWAERDQYLFPAGTATPSLDGLLTRHPGLC